MSERSETENFRISVGRSSFTDIDFGRPVALKESSPDDHHIPENAHYIFSYFSLRL